MKFKSSITEHTSSGSGNAGNSGNLGSLGFSGCSLPLLFGLSDSPSSFSLQPISIIPSADKQINSFFILINEFQNRFLENQEEFYWLN